MGKKRAGIEEKKRVKGISNPLSGRLLPLKQAAEYVGFSTWGMREAIWKGLVPVFRLPEGRKMWLDRADLDEFIEQNKNTIA